MKSLIIVVLISFAIVSCEFDPVGTYDLDSVDEKIPVTIVADNDSDTLHLWGVQKITFTAETEGKRPGGPPGQAGVGQTEAPIIRLRQKNLGRAGDQP